MTEAIEKNARGGSAGQTAQARKSVLSQIIQMANPVFVIIAVFVPIGALVYALVSGSLLALNYVHILTGGLWTGIDLFMGFVLGPVLGSMDPAARVSLFRRLMPKMTFLMPVIAAVTATAGLKLAGHIGYSLTSPKIIAALIITGILTVQGFGLLLPNEIRIFQQLLSDKPDTALISKLGMSNARLGGLQGVFQLGIIFIMAFIRF
ncbi:MAG: hypothetical protein Q7T05_04185 [Dehalococcoidia bacterium]|nr:hypothetical protein [Dehalococcoidia bacterium]